MSKKILTREVILQAEDIQSVYVEIPEWKGGVYVRGMTGQQRDDFEASLVKMRGNNREINMKNARAKLVYLCTVDGKGIRIFSETDIAALGKKSAKALDRIFKVAQDLSGITDEDIKDLTENLEGTSSEG